MRTDDGESRRPAPDAVAGLDVASLLERAEAMLLDGPRRYTRIQVADLVGADPDQTRRLWRSLGFADAGDDDVMFTDGDVSALQLVSRLSDAGIAGDAMRNSMTRLLGQTFARLASSQGQLIVNLLAQRPELLESEDAMVAVLAQLTPLMEQIQNHVWRRQLVAYFSRVASYASAELATPTLVPMCVGFADISGFTSLTRRSTEAELGELLETFEALSTEVVGAHGGRIVKTIGDEVLFVADAPAHGAEIALELFERVRDHAALPPLRIGLAAGPVVVRLGDVYGSTVNIASRLTSLARPGWVLVDRGMADSLGPDRSYALKSRRPESVRGFHHLRQWRLRRADDVTGRSSRAGRIRSR
ncbi:MAG: adenylate/guanylate cyclase domain-containing protein [Jatrophihabitantaceae bacterium]